MKEDFYFRRIKKRSPKAPKKLSVARNRAVPILWESAEERNKEKKKTVFAACSGAGPNKPQARFRTSE